MRFKTAILFCLVFAAASSQPKAGELSGFIGAEYTLFFFDPLYPSQNHNAGSFVLQPEYEHNYANGNSIIFTPFARCDSSDSERTHADIRELSFRTERGPWEFYMGIGKVFWGVTEFVHLVDIINQTDLVENIDMEDKLGQPMVNLSLFTDLGSLDFYVLPFFRERTYPGRNGRLRWEPRVKADEALYESSAEQYHVDFALRYSQTFGDADIGLYHFKGTGRQPSFRPQLDGSEWVLVPYYEQIDQTGMDGQLVVGPWLLKLEAIYRTGQDPDFFSFVTGFEYTFTNVAGTAMDLGVIGEYAYDDRDENAATPFENDLMFGIRLAVNDQASSDLLLGVMKDLDSSALFATMEANRRIGENWTLTLEGKGFWSVPESDYFYCIRQDDYIRLILTYYL